MRDRRFFASLFDSSTSDRRGKTMANKKHCAVLILDVHKTMNEEGLRMGKDALALHAMSRLAKNTVSEMGLVLAGTTGEGHCPEPVRRARGVPTRSRSLGPQFHRPVRRLCLTSIPHVAKVPNVIFIVQNRQLCIALCPPHNLLPPTHKLAHPTVGQVTARSLHARAGTSNALSDDPSATGFHSISTIRSVEPADRNLLTDIEEAKLGGEAGDSEPPLSSSPPPALLCCL